MNYTKYIVVVCFVVGLALLYRLGCSHEEARLRRTWQELVEKGQKTSDQSMLVMARRATELPAYFTTGAVIEVGAPYPMTLTRAQLPSIMNQVWTHADRVSIHDRGSELQLASDRRQAVMEVTLELAAELKGEKQTGLDAYTIQWVKVDGDWRIQRVKRLGTIQNPAWRPPQ